MRTGRALTVLAVLAFAAPTKATATNWADTTQDAADDPAFAGSKAICRAHKATPIPSPPAGPAAAKGCSSERLAEAIATTQDGDAAWRCAVAEREADSSNEDLFAGTAMLMTLFANGRGAPRDLDAAIALACTLDGAPAEMDGRVNHLAALQASGPGPTAFSPCDDVTSGAGQGACAAHDSAIAARARNAAFAAIAAGLDPAGKASLARLQSAMEAFAVARGENEIDLSGTARLVFQLEAEDAVRDDLLQILKPLPGGRPKALDTAAVDKALNAAYAAVMATQDPQWGTPTKDGIRETERKWLAYRDALRLHMAAVAGAGQADAAVAALTARRAGQLRDIMP